MALPTMDRRAAVKKLLDARDGALVVTGLGSPSYDVHAAGDRDDNYYLWGAMGGAALVGLGLAQAQPRRRVMVITGDGEQLMAFGSLATISVARPKNLDLIILDNQHFGETGMQSSHTGRGIGFDRVAAACCFAEVAELRSLEEVDA
ncbi:aldehyde dehydrogenase, partial [Mesorhizobium sp. M2C.T.Ca.TU.009.01.2.1]